MTAVDLIVLAWVALAALQGARRGLVANAFGLAGFAIGAVVGARLAPYLLTNGTHSGWVPAASLTLALIAGLGAQAAAGALAVVVRRRLVRGPLASFDTAGGLALGGLLGVALVWLAAVVAIDQPGLGLRRDVQRSTILPALLRDVPATTVLNALEQFDPLPVLPSLADRALPPPDTAVLRSQGALQARLSVVRITGIACGLGIQGSGWVAEPGLVVTNAHVVAGEAVSGQTVTTPSGHAFGGRVVAVDATDDIALIRVPRLPLPPLRMATHTPSGASVVLIGYPRDGPLTAVAGRAGSAITVVAPNAYGSGVGARSVIPLRGILRHGDSGGAVITPDGRVTAMMFAAEAHGDGGFGVPLDPIRSLIAHPRLAGTGPCIG